MNSAAVRDAYLDGIGVLVAMVANRQVLARWTEPSVLAGMTVSTLVGHVSLSVFQVESFLAAEHDERYRVDAITYYARLSETANPDAAFNVGIRSRADEVAGAGYEVLHQDLSDAAARLTLRIPTEGIDQTVSIVHRPGETMLLDEYLKTRCIELAVHLDDLAMTLNSPNPVPEHLSTVACQVLVAAARQRHGSLALLRALARRERDDLDALRVV